MLKMSAFSIVACARRCENAEQMFELFHWADCDYKLLIKILKR